MDERIFVGVVRLVLRIPGARSLKDGRRSVVSLRDRLRHRFDLTFNEVGQGERPDMRIVVLTTAGKDRRVIQTMLDRAVQFVHASGSLIATEVDLDVFRWHRYGQLDEWHEEPEDG
jgi:uncharacterized protein YlxP (DUF503 family)